MNTNDIFTFTDKTAAWIADNLRYVQEANAEQNITPAQMLSYRMAGDAALDEPALTSDEQDLFLSLSASYLNEGFFSYAWTERVIK